MNQQRGPYPVARASRQQPSSLPAIPDVFADELEEDDSYYDTRFPTSARRYVEPRQQVIQRGNKRIVIHNEPPPRLLRFHWLTYVGIIAIIMLIGWLAVTMLGTFWQNKQDDWAYGNPRTYQTDANVGHGPMSHFIAVNLHGTVQVIEDDTNGAHLYNITTLQGGDGNVPVTLSFRDINADGKLDMLVIIGDAGANQFTVFLFNNGSQFVSKL